MDRSVIEEKGITSEQLFLGFNSAGAVPSINSLTHQEPRSVLDSLNFPNFVQDIIGQKLPVS
jgi:hypothetical protein